MPRPVSAPRHRAPAARPAWSTPREALRVACEPAHLRRALLVAGVVGTVLFAINQLDLVLRGEATTAVWLKSAVTYVVPFVVCIYGILVATHRRDH